MTFSTLEKLNGIWLAIPSVWSGILSTMDKTFSLGLNLFKIFSLIIYCFNRNYCDGMKTSGFGIVNDSSKDCGNEESLHKTMKSIKWIFGIFTFFFGWPWNVKSNGLCIVLDSARLEICIPCKIPWQLFSTLCFLGFAFFLFLENYDLMGIVEIKSKKPHDCWKNQIFLICPFFMLHIRPFQYLRLHCTFSCIFTHYFWNSRPITFVLN